MKDIKGCPICGSVDFREGKQCRKLKETVCITCCEACEHYILDDFYVRHTCSYGLAEEAKKEKRRAELFMQVRKLEKKQGELYRKGRPHEGDSIAWELATMKKELKELEGA